MFDMNQVLNDLLQDRMSSLVEHFNTSFTHDRNNMQEWVNAAKEVIPEEDRYGGKSRDAYLMSLYGLERAKRLGAKFHGPWYNRELIRQVVNVATIWDAELYCNRIRTDEEVLKLAEQVAEDVLADFISKMSKKLNGIGAVKNASISQDTHLQTSVLNIEFTNGIRTTMVNSIIHKMSKLGKHFCQFPCRFHNTTLNGELVKNVNSEASIKKLAASIQNV